MRFAIVAALLCMVATACSAPTRTTAITPAITVAPIVEDSIPRFDTNAIEWKIIPVSEVSAAGGQMITLYVHRKYHDLSPVYRLVGRDREGRRHDVAVPFHLWAITPANDSMMLPVIRVYPQRYP